MASEITRLLRDRYGDRLEGVLLEGSTAKGLDRPTSDLEFTAILDSGQDRWCAFFHGGMFVGISYHSVEKATADAENIEPDWPVAGDALQTGVICTTPEDSFPGCAR